MAQLSAIIELEAKQCHQARVEINEEEWYRFSNLTRRLGCYPTADELEETPQKNILKLWETLATVIISVQKIEFGQEYQDLANQKYLNTQCKSPLVMRVGGRLNNSAISFSQKHSRIATSLN